MAGRLEGKTAFVTGVARGQGRSHAVALAREGADIIGIDLPRPIDNMTYPLATTDDLEETVRLVKETGRSIVTHAGDVRDRSSVDEAVAAGISTFGKIDIVVGNAGVCPLGPNPPGTFLDVVDVNLVGLINTFNATYRHLGEGASMIAIGSVAGMTPSSVDNAANGPGGAGYGFSKRAIAQLVHDFSVLVAPQQIRVNTIHPSNCDTDMLQNDAMYRIFRPDLESPTKDDATMTFPMMNAMPVPWVEASDVSNAVVFLASDESRYVTGLQMKVDAGALAKALPL